ncbi:hypothetical protein AK37_25090 [Rhodococcus pyridinivorans AK37]|uniref:Uncharacterized protein n=1 Tax=Rhodococcus pyridinivorans AK37 TaxID=1114960 RepID=H0JZ08_9NOCA|nr:hypothetical protein AK37_25090 [Rhodococcus pyridinivorans AK37]
MGILPLASCVTNTDVPTTFPAVVTLAGEADRAIEGSGECFFGEIRIAPNDLVTIFGDGGPAWAQTVVEVESIDEDVEGGGHCIYVARFDTVPANQRSYTMFVDSITLPSQRSFAPQSFTGDDLRNGATFRLSGPASP